MKAILIQIRSIKLISLIVALLLCSCEHQDLCLDHSHIVDLKVIFDWQHAPEASPATMSLYLFPEDGDEAMRYEFVDYHGGTIRIPIGNYKIFCINSDTEVIRYRNEDQFETFELITRNTSALVGIKDLGLTAESAPRADGAENERTAYSCDPIWSDRVESFEISEKNAPLNLTLSPKSVVNNYTIEIVGAENLKYVKGLSGSLSGLTEGYLPGIDDYGSDRVTIPFEVKYSENEGVISGMLRTFGHCYDTNVEHKLVIYAVMSDGDKYFYTFDVTEQIHSALDQRNIHIVIDGLTFPKPITNGGGFKPDVSEWNSVEIDIEM